MNQPTYIIIVKNLFAFSFNKTFFGVLLILLAVNTAAIYSEETLVLNITKALFVPVLLAFYFIKNKILSVSVFSFFLFSFLADTSSIYINNDTFINTSSVLYFLSYMCLISIIVSKFRILQLANVLKSYLLIMVLISVYFLYIIHGFLKVVVADPIEVFLFGVKSVSLIMLAIIAFGTYLSNETKSSILFLKASLCIVFSVILNYVSMYYIYNWSFIILDRALYGTGLFILFSYLIEENKNSVIVEQYNSKNIFA